LDVQPAAKEDGWNTEPFVLTEQGGKLFGRGSSDDKGPVLAWLNAIEVMQGLGVEIPINLKVIEKGEAIIGKIPNFSSFSKEWKKAGRRDLTVIFFPAENNFYYVYQKKLSQMSS
jgi:nonspecific dipeptidase